MAQEDLVLTATPRPKRPTEYSPDVIEAAVRQLAPKVLEWTHKGDSDPLATEESVFAELLAAFQRTYSDEDGYRLARRLENEGYDPDAELVEILDQYGSYLLNARREAVEKWVLENSVELSLTEGTLVIPPPHLSSQEPQGNWSVTGLHPKTAQYRVSPPGARQSFGYIVDAEKIKPLANDQTEEIIKA